MINQGGHLSEQFRIFRGCRQGDPLSPYIFILCIEILSILIKNNKNIEGVVINDKEMKISLYADDVSLILNGSEKSLRESLRTLNRFSEISGLYINYEKTEVIWIGCKKFCTESLCHDYSLEWGKSNFKLLGVKFDVNLKKMIDLNYDSKLISMKNISNNWKRRNLTPYGKIVVIKSLALSIFTHLFISLPSPSTSRVKDIEKHLYSFIWNGKPDRIKRNIMVKDYSDGGLNMIHVSAFIKKLKLSWVRDFLFKDKSWKYIQKSIDKNKLFNCGPEYAIQKSKLISNCFWRDILQIWGDFCEKVEFESKCVALTPIFFNKNIRVNNKCIYFKSWADKQIFYVNDIIDTNGNFYSYNEFQEIFDVGTNFIDYYSVVSSIKQWLRTSGKTNNLCKLPYPMKRYPIFYYQIFNLFPK